MGFHTGYFKNVELMEWTLTLGVFALVDHQPCYGEPIGSGQENHIALKSLPKRIL